MLHARRRPDAIARADCAHRTAFGLYPAMAGGDDEELAQRMDVPVGARAWLECDGGAPKPRAACAFEGRGHRSP